MKGKWRSLGGPPEILFKVGQTQQAGASVHSACLEQDCLRWDNHQMTRVQ